MQLMILDGNSIINRAFYGVRLLSTRDGLYTNAIFGFLNILQKLLDEAQPDALCVTFDRKAPTFRHLKYAEYKGTRHKMPEELAMQLPVLREVLDAMRIPYYELDGWEADDLMGTISRQFEALGWSCQLVTGDKDTLQLITPKTTVKLVTTAKGQTSWRDMTPDAFRAQYGFDPIHMIDLKGLMGDTSDNIPGIKGVGEKTAIGLIQSFGSIDGLYQNFDDSSIKGALRTKLEAGKENALLSREIATISTDAPVTVVAEDVLRREIDKDALYRVFLRLEFTKLIERYDLSAPKATAQPVVQPAATWIDTQSGWLELLPTLQQCDGVAVLPLPALDGIALRTSGGLYLMLENRYDGDFRALLRDIFGAKLKLIAHGVKEITHLLLENRLPAEGFVFDVGLAAYLLSPTDGSYDLPKLGLSYFNREYAPSKVYSGEDCFAPLCDSTDALLGWCEHTELIYQLHTMLAPKIEEFQLASLLYEMELPLCRVLAEMELAGIFVDRPALNAFGEMLSTRIDETQKNIYDMAGGEFNIKSTVQLGEVLFERLGLPAIKKTKRGYSTDAAVLEKLSSYHPIINEILDYRKYTKLKSTYVDGLEKEIAADGRIHTCFQNTVTATGRLSSTEPNLQNIPVRTPLGAEMRKMFLAPEGRVLVDADYSQIELRLMAHIAADASMGDAFRSGADIHTSTAAQVMGVAPEEVTKEMRASAKAVNFGIVYGISDFSLAGDIGVTIQQAREYMKRYFSTYSGVRRYQKEIVEQAKENGYVSPIYGRRRWLPELKSSNINLRAFGERVALNMPFQGSAADIIKLEMLAVSRRL